jgi:hypothetical protein
MSAGFVFRIYDALDPVPEMPHLRMDTEASLSDEYHMQNTGKPIQIRR